MENQNKERACAYLGVEASVSDLIAVCLDENNSTISSEREPLETRVELHPFLVGLRPHHVKLLADCAMAKHFAADEYLFRK